MMKLEPVLDASDLFKYSHYWNNPALLSGFLHSFFRNAFFPVISY